jgi:hypothetical protein
MARKERAASPDAEKKYKNFTPEEQTELADGSVEFAWSIAPSNISQEACEKIQRYALEACSYYDGATNAPCSLLVNDQIADPVLREDGPAVNELIVKSLQLSVSPFFLKELRDATAAPAK